MPSYTSGGRIWVNAARDTVVPEGSPEARYLLVGEGGTVDEATAQQLGLQKDLGKNPPVEAARTLTPADAAPLTPTGVVESSASDEAKAQAGPSSTKALGTSNTK